jgi:hypothetical protein
MIKPTEFEVSNGEGIGCTVRIDPETLLDGPMFFVIDQDADSIIVTLECLQGLLDAAQHLQKAQECFRIADQELLTE